MSVEIQGVHKTFRQHRATAQHVLRAVAGAA
jgi:hypothetical protein